MVGPDYYGPQWGGAKTCVHPTGGYGKNSLVQQQSVQSQVANIAKATPNYRTPKDTPDLFVVRPPANKKRKKTGLNKTEQISTSKKS